MIIQKSQKISSKKKFTGTIAYTVYSFLYQNNSGKKSKHTSGLFTTIMNLENFSTGEHHSIV